MIEKREEIARYILDNVALFDCQGDCPDEVGLGEMLRTPEYCAECFTRQILSLTEKKIDEVRNPYPATNHQWQYWEEARKAILQAIKGGQR